MKVFRPASVSDARRLVSALTGIATALEGQNDSPRDFLRGRCTTPEQVDQLVALVRKLDWEAWRREFVRYEHNPSTAAWNRLNLERWPEVTRARDDGSLFQAMAAAAEGAKADLREWAARWRPG